MLPFVVCSLSAWRRLPKSGISLVIPSVPRSGDLHRLKSLILLRWFFMKKIVAFLSHPVFNIAAGLLIYLFGGHLIYCLGDTYSPSSALVGAVSVIGISTFDYGFGAFRAARSKRDE